MHSLPHSAIAAEEYFLSTVSAQFYVAKEKIFIYLVQPSKGKQVSDFIRKNISR